MPVRRVNRKKKVAARKKSNAADIKLPVHFTEPENELYKYVTLIHGSAGVGKTTLVNSYPGVVFLATEPGTKGQRRREFNAENGGITSWEVFRQCVSMLVKDNKRNFKTVAIDSIERAFSFCQEWVEKSLGVQYVGDAKFGKGWERLKKEFRGQLNKLIKADYGLVMTSHSKVATITSSSGTEYNYIQPNLTGTLMEIIDQIIDCSFYAEFVKGIKGSEDNRILIVQGSELIYAKSRNKNLQRAKFLPLRYQNGYDVLEKIFNGTMKGLDPNNIRGGVHTRDEVVTEIGLSKAKAKAKRKPIRKGGRS